MTVSEVRDATERSRFEVLVEGVVAGFAEYELRGHTIAFTHTEMDQAYSGRGLASRLIKAALESARERDLRVLPFCPFVRSWIEKHPDFLDLVPETSRSRFGLLAG
ncbi:GNAT family N-acetyltransferase [Pseudonocardia sp. TRM90224]|uniref:GNAT family N-acetyltransferase n=1 Tax=Pseudonocardia sp. TRM90224 TaxID=2812678 RepID=UPI001E412757|nr:GNAT family N-acetyltransferase [Pseudonocardia sp. TRM90224]